MCGLQENIGLEPDELVFGATQDGCMAALCADTTSVATVPKGAFIMCYQVPPLPWLAKRMKRSRSRSRSRSAAKLKLQGEAGGSEVVEVVDGGASDVKADDVDGEATAVVETDDGAEHVHKHGKHHDHNADHHHRYHSHKRRKAKEEAAEAARAKKEGPPLLQQLTPHTKGVCILMLRRMVRDNNTPLCILFPRAHSRPIVRRLCGGFPQHSMPTGQLTPTTTTEGASPPRWCRRRSATPSLCLCTTFLARTASCQLQARYGISVVCPQRVCVCASHCDDGGLHNSNPNPLNRSASWCCRSSSAC